MHGTTSTAGGISYSSPQVSTGRSTRTGGRFGLRNVARSIAESVKGLRDWIKPPGKPIKAWRVAVVTGIGVGAICLGVAAWKVAGLVVAGVTLIGGGYLIYRCNQPSMPYLPHD